MLLIYTVFLKTDFQQGKYCMHMLAHARTNILIRYIDQRTCKCLKPENDSPYPYQCTNVNIRKKVYKDIDYILSYVLCIYLLTLNLHRKENQDVLIHVK